MFRICLSPMTWLEEKVYMLLKYHGISRPGEIDLYDLCKCYGMEIRLEMGRSRTFEDPDHPGRFVIQVDRLLSEYEQRVKIAHEFGHLLLHEGVQLDSCNLFTTMQESQITHFVEHLLMPYFMFEELDYKMNRYEVPKYLSQLFKVPEYMAKSRFERFLNRLYTHGMVV